MTFANLGGLTGRDDLGCVSLALPSAFKIGSATVTASPPDTSWKAMIGGQTIVINTAERWRSAPAG